MSGRVERTGVMLCQPLNSRNITKMPLFVAFQPKYRGNRCVTEYLDGSDKPLLISSFGNKLEGFEHIENEIEKYNRLTGTRLHFDGEMYKHGWSQEKINGICSRKKNFTDEVKELSYYIYDVKERGTFTERFLKRNFNFFPPMIFVPTEIGTVSTWQDRANKMMKQGYEGLIIRNLDGQYVEKRSKDIIKFKPTEEDEYIILNIIEAVDKHGFPKNMVGAFLVKAPDLDEAFEVGAGKLTHGEREVIWKNRSSYIGKNLVVKHEILTTNSGIPLCCVAVNIKE